MTEPLFRHEVPPFTFGGVRTAMIELLFRGEVPLFAVGGLESR